MRLFALLLIFANILLWSYRDYVGPRLAANSLVQQVHPERLRLIGAVELAKGARSAPPCVAYGPLDEGKLTLAKALARELQKEISTAERRTEKGAYLELREPNSKLRDELGELLPDVREEVCPG
jgi:hypothetical protein